MTPTPPPRVLGDCLEALRDHRACWRRRRSPGRARELWRRLGLAGTPEDERLPEAASWGRGPVGAPLDKGAPLFPRIES